MTGIRPPTILGIRGLGAEKGSGAEKSMLLSPLAV
jgi:hypothetical protein